jgi:hypothetical protein
MQTLRRNPGLDVVRCLEALLHTILLVVLVLGALIDGAEFVRYKFERAFFSPPRPISSEIITSRRAHKRNRREQNHQRRRRELSSLLRGLLLQRGSKFGLDFE